MILEHNQMRIDFCKENLKGHCCETTRKCDGLCNNCFLEVVPQFVQYCKANEQKQESHGKENEHEKACRNSYP